MRVHLKMHLIGTVANPFAGIAGDSNLLPM